MLAEAFKQLPFFEGLSPAHFACLQKLFYLYEYSEGTHLFEQGDPAEFLYLVVEGEVVVNFKPDDGPVITVAHIHPGSIVGWSAALGSRKYTSGALCATSTQLLRVRGVDLRKLCKQNSDLRPILLDRLATVIAERLSKAHDQVVALLEQGLRNGVLV